MPELTSVTAHSCRGALASEWSSSCQCGRTLSAKARSKAAQVQLAMVPRRSEIAEDRSWRCIGGYHLRGAPPGQDVFPEQTALYRFLFGAIRGKLLCVKILLVAAFLTLAAATLQAQEAELPPIVVTGTFELRPGPSIMDRFTQHLLKQMETNRAVEEAVARAPWFNAPFWKYLPALQSSSTDSFQFFTPSYLTSDYRNTERALEVSRKQSVFDGQ